jgi:putative hemin transport protein
MTPDLAQRWHDLLTAEPRLRIREAAQRLHTSEMELLCTRLGRGVTRLTDGWGAWIERIPALGDVMALTRNEHAVHEKHGQYKNIEINWPIGLAVDKEIDLRLFLHQWRFGFAVEEPPGDPNPRRSFQFFDAHGGAIHKIYLTEHSDLPAWQALAADHAHPDPRDGLAVTPRPAPTPETPDAEIDAVAFQADWRALEDTHDFFGLLRRYGLSRPQALRLAPDGFALPLAAGALRRTLEGAAAQELSIMIFVGNPGAIQIHTGPVQRLVTTGPWFNVLDPRFNLHLREGAIAAAWLVRKPTVDGVVTSVELFDDRGDNIAMLFGERKPGIPEDLRWRALAEALPR